MTDLIRTDPKALARIERAIVSHPDASPTAIETAAELVGGWIDRYEDQDRYEKTVAVEIAFNVKLDPYTYVVGVIDRLSLDSDDLVYVVNEWKTTKGASDRPGPYAWTAQRWLDEITTGVQLPTYALALTAGEFILKRGLKGFKIKDARRLNTVRVRVRAAVKVSPPQFWPDSGERAKYEPGIYEFSAEDIAAVRASYLNAAVAIRALRSSRLVPWQHSGSHCHRQFGRDCSLLPRCSVHDYAQGAYRVYDPGDGDFDYLKRFGLESIARDRRTVILSASSYGTFTTCHEKWRVLKGLGVAEEGTNDLPLQIGGAFHAGAAEFYSIMKERY